MNLDGRAREIVDELKVLRRLVASSTLLDIADRTVAVGDGLSLSKSTISDLLRGKFGEKSGPNVALLASAMADLAAHSPLATASEHRVLALWAELTSPAPRWSAGDASHFAELEWNWGSTNVYPDSPGVRYAFAIMDMSPTRRPLRPEVFTSSLRTATLRLIDRGPLRAHGGFDEYSTVTDTGFRVWGPIEESWGLPRRFVSISVSIFGATSCYWFGERTVASDDGIPWTPERAAFSSLLWLQQTIGSSGDASISTYTEKSNRTRAVSIPEASAATAFQGFDWQYGVVDSWLAERTGSDETAGILYEGPGEFAPTDMHPAERHFRLEGDSNYWSTPLMTLGRRLG